MGNALDNPFFGPDPFDDYPLRVLCYGDSNTAGFYNYGRGFAPYAKALQEELALYDISGEVVHVGLSGLTAQEMAMKANCMGIPDVTHRSGKGLNILLSESSFHIAIIMVGTNDIGRGAAPKDILNYAKRLHKICHQHKVVTIGIGPVTASAPVAVVNIRNQFAQLLENYVDRDSAVMVYEDAADLMPKTARQWWEPDDLHFSPLGSRHFGEAMAEAVAESTETINAAFSSTLKTRAVLGEPPSFLVGQEVQYFTGSTWASAKVTAVTDVGLQLDALPGILLNREQQDKFVRLDRNKFMYYA